MARRAANGNNKGGSGKTGITINMAASLAEAGKNVLLVDCDPQGNLTRRMGYPYDPGNLLPGMAEAIKDGGEGVAASAIIPCKWGGTYSERIHLIPARYDLENRVSEAGNVGAGLRLRRAMRGVDEDYDYTLFDLPPSLGHLTQLALAAVDVAFAVVDPEVDGIEGAVRFRDWIDAHAEDIGNPGLRMGGFIVSRYRANINAHAFQVEGLPDLFGKDNLLDPIIPERTAVKDAADTMQPLRALGTADGRKVADLFDTLTKNYTRIVG